MKINCKNYFIGYQSVNFLCLKKAQYKDFISNKQQEAIF